MSDFDSILDKYTKKHQKKLEDTTLAFNLLRLTEGYEVDISTFETVANILSELNYYREKCRVLEEK